MMKKARKALGYNQQMAADMLGWSRFTYSRYENDHWRLSYSKAQDVMAILGITDIDSFFDPLYGLPLSEAQSDRLAKLWWYRTMLLSEDRVASSWPFDPSAAIDEWKRHIQMDPTEVISGRIPADDRVELEGAARLLDLSLEQTLLLAIRVFFAAMDYPEDDPERPHPQSSSDNSSTAS